MIGRKHEIEQLIDAYESEQSEFVAVYGRRRIGKTFLITEAFGNRFAFHHTGLREGGTKKQLEQFRLSLRQQGYYDCPRIKDWSEFYSSSLKILLMLGNNRIESINFINNLPNLKSLVFEGTIGNGDIKSLKRLERCALTPHKRFYNVSQKELTYPQNYKTLIDLQDDVNCFSNRYL